MFSNVQEREEMDFHRSTEAEVDQDDAHSRGQRNTDSQWILSSRDVWYKNPYYHGPDQPHPEMDDHD